LRCCSPDGDSGNGFKKIAALHRMLQHKRDRFWRQLRKVRAKA
jgi:hypothetical protein